MKTNISAILEKNSNINVYKEIRRLKTATKVDLHYKLNIKLGTLTKILEELLEANLIEEFGFGESTGGRKPIIYSINGNIAYTFGLDLSRNYVRGIIQNLLIEKKGYFYIELTGKEEPESLMEIIAEKFYSLRKELKIDSSKVLGLGVACVGPIDKNRKVMIDPFQYEHPNWRNFPVGFHLAKLLDISVYLENGANSALRAEYWMRSDTVPNNIVYMHINSGFRSSIAINQHIIDGSIGQMIIQTDGIKPLNPYGNYGSLHAYVTKSYILNKVKGYLKQHRKCCLNNLDPDEVSYEDIQKALGKNDALIKEVVLEASTYLGIGISNIVNVFQPQVIILGGDLAHCSIYYENAISVARKNTYVYSQITPIYIKSNLNEFNIVSGAGILVMDNLIDAIK